MKISQGCTVFGVLLCLTLSAHCKVLDLEARSSPDDNSLQNVNITEPERRPFLELLTTMEKFVEGSIHTLIQDFMVRNTTILESLPQVISSPLQAFHNFTVQMEAVGDSIFNRQERIIHLVQCECPDEDNKCNHILARKIETPAASEEGERDIKDRENNEGKPNLPLVDVIKLVRHFQRHFGSVLQTQRKVFEYAQCACPNKKQCMRSKAESASRGRSVDYLSPSEEYVKVRVVRSAEPQVQYQPRGFFDGFFSWFSNLFSGSPTSGVIIGGNGNYPHGTHLYNGTLPNGAHYTGGEYHNGNANGYFVSTIKNDSNGNYYSASSSSSTFGRK